MTRAVRAGAPALLALFLACACGCGKGAANASPAASSSAAAVAADGGVALDDDGGGPMDALESEAWSRAQDGGGDDDDIRLADLEGCTGLRERAAAPALRATALRAMAYCRDFSELPWLADLGARGSDSDALAALDAIVDQAARVRRATDPEDADELHGGCAALLDLANAKERPAPRRVRAIRALRMLADRDCVKRADIPADLDAK
ncbi:MAG TPA: hypothetical protein VHV30_05580 [Polyangiaceae bacterium]|nr:hypothetical protein [Polyangiaceae bacterium]